jgi:peptidoglycan/LPS O-acetylase OafA/YrhL
MGVGLIRTLLALSVVLAHSSKIGGYNIADGFVAVQSFYIISGFYMALILNDKYTGPNRLWLFASNRFLRLYPIYWIILLSSIAVSAYCYLHDRGAGLYLQAWMAHGAQLSVLQRLYLISANVLLFGQDSALFLKFTGSGLLAPTRNFYASQPMLYEFLFVPQAWTLGVELLFYCVAPFIVRKGLSYILGLITLSLVLRIMLTNMGLSADPWNYRFFPTELALFCGGCVAYYRYRTLTSSRTTASWAPPTLTGLILTALIFFNYMPGPYAIRQCGFYMALVVFLPYMFIWSKTNRFDRFVGELSYPIYISHHLICLILVTFAGVQGSWFGVVAAGVSVLAALALQILVQRPIDRFRRRRTEPAIVTATVKGAARSRPRAVLEAVSGPRG